MEPQFNVAVFPFGIDGKLVRVTFFRLNIRGQRGGIDAYFLYGRLIAVDSAEFCGRVSYSADIATKLKLLNIRSQSINTWKTYSRPDLEYELKQTIAKKAMQWMDAILTGKEERK